MSLDVNISEPDEFNCNELHGCIDKVAKIKGLDDFIYHVDFVCGKGDNFIANVFRILIKDVQNEDKQYSFIIKTLINTARQELFYELHKREVKVYEKIVKKYEKLQETLDDEDRIVFPKCEYTRSEKTQEVIILEDMKEKGYETDTKLARYEHLNYSQVRTVVKALAKLHALSIIHEQADPSFAGAKSEFQDIIFSENFLDNSKLRNYFNESFGMALCLVEDWKAKDKLEQIRPKLLELLKMYTRPGKFNVLCHGDCWINNIMFKHGDEIETKVCFIDFQAMRYSSPFTDLFHFIFLCTDSDFRLTHFEDLMTEYYDTLKSFLNIYGIDINLVYPKEEFEIDLKDLLPFGLLLAMIELRIITTTPEDEAILKGSNIVPGSSTSEVLGEADYFRIRVNDLVNESVRNGILDKLLDMLNVV